MEDRRVVAVAILLSAAIAVATTLALQPGSPASPPAPSAASDPARFGLLESRLQKLEARGNPAPAPAPVVLPEPLRTPATELPEDRLLAIEARLHALEQRSPAAPPAQVPAEQAEEPPPPPTQEEAMQVLLDPRASVAAKLRAHESLRHTKDAYTPAMVQELLHIGRTNADGQVRADVWRFFDGASQLPAIVPPLLDALAADADAKAREEAAETLGNYLDDPAVRAALQQAADHDGAAPVRAKAKRTLDGIQPSQGRLGSHDPRSFR